MLILSVNPLHEDEATRARTWEARTRHRRCRTRVRRGGTRRRAGDAAACASSRVRPRGSHVVFTDASRYGFDARRRKPIRADSGLNRPEPAGIGGIGRNSRFRPKFKKKKKKNPRTHRFHRNSKHTPHITSHSLCLCASVLSVSSHSLPHYYS